MTGPALPGSGANDDPMAALARRIQSMERDVQELKQQLGALTGMTYSGNEIRLEPGTQLTVADGALNVEGGDGVQVTAEGGISVFDQRTDKSVVYIGSNVNAANGVQQMVFEVWRDDGTQVLGMADNGVVPGHPHQQALQWWDRQGNIVFADDTVSGQGLATPWIPGGGFVDYLAAPTAVTNSATYTSIQIAQYYKQHPNVVVALVIRSDTGTTGNVRLVDENGAAIGAPIAVAAASFFIAQIGPAAVPGTWGLGKNLFIQAQRTGGTGNIGVRGMSAYGVQS